MKHLVNCKDDYEAQLICGLMAVAGIPVHREYRGAGQLLKIYCGIGRDVDLYVPANRLAEAQELLATAGSGDEDWD